MNDYIGYNPNTYMNPYPTTYPQVRMPSIQTSVPMQGKQLDKVNGIESAKAFPTTPNSMVALFDANDDVFYLKTTDASNFPTIRRFRFYEETEEEAQSEKYVTIDEFNKFKEEMLNEQQHIRNANKSANSNRGNKQSATNQKHDGNDAE